MNKFLLTISFISLLLNQSCSQKDSCEQLPHNFATYDEAIQKIKSSNFEIQEDINISKSSWIRGASFYCCNGRSGYFILVTDKKEYLYSDMPYSIWRAFKNADSFGKFYNENIKYKYIFQLTK